MTKITKNLKQGTIIGGQDVLPNGKTFNYFKGIPYAEPPIGKLRFKPPVKLEKFPEQPLDCTIERDVCFQKDIFSEKVMGSEDCLFLNVYTPLINNRNTILPVMIWIHGGGFSAGSGNSDMYSPEYLIQQDVIIVTCNYRLGPLGFLCLPDVEIPGNAGIKDQLLVLNWVNENIHQFDGDKNNVTLFGESAGATSVYLHVLCDQSKPYFHKAICQSGLPLMEWSIQKDPVGKSEKLIELLGYQGPEKNHKKMLEFLNEKSAAEICRKMLKTLTKDELRRGLPMPFKPSIEYDLPGAILTKSIIQLHNQENSIKIPLIIGYNSNEGIYMLRTAFYHLNDYDQDLGRMIPRTLNVHPDDINGRELAKKMKEFYFNNETIDATKLNELANVQTDYHFGIHSIATVEIHAKKQHNSPLYFYRFSFDGDYNFGKKGVLLKLGLDNGKLLGAAHGDEMFYLFNIKAMGYHDEQSKSGKTSLIMCKLWTNFAKFNNPTPSTYLIDDIKFKWNPIKSVSSEEQVVNIDYLDIGDECRMRQNPDEERVNFWRNQYKKWNSSFLKQKL